ncbi:MAG: hypothetical protein RIC55_00015 [Pirellulaceae bacterium]
MTSTVGQSGSLKSNAQSKVLRPILVLFGFLGILLTLVVVLLIGGTLELDEYDELLFMAMLIPHGVYALAAAWGAIGPGKAIVRIPASLAVALISHLVFWAVFVMLQAGGELSIQAIWSAIRSSPLQFFSAQIPFAFAICLTGWRLVGREHADSGDYALRRPGAQKIMLTLGLVTGVICLANLQELLALYRIGSFFGIGSLDSSFWLWGYLLRLAGISMLLGCLVVMPFTWALLPRRISVLRVTIAVALAALSCAPLVILHNIPLLLEQSGSASFLQYCIEEVLRWQTMPMTVLPLACLLGVLACRLAGFRLVGEGDVRREQKSGQGDGVINAR